ncbi:MAG TPA: hypothetical protein VHF05_02190 [Candidatus Paceibacterota bacterium]|nr:hypothetical protein [Candidatus Paceibacterota bacterium]
MGLYYSFKEKARRKDFCRTLEREIKRIFISRGLNAEMTIEGLDEEITELTFEANQEDMTVIKIKVFWHSNRCDYFNLTVGEYEKIISGTFLLDGRKMFRLIQNFVDNRGRAEELLM